MTVGKDVFKYLLNVDEDCAEETSEGKPFQTRGAATIIGDHLDGRRVLVLC